MKRTFKLKSFDFDMNFALISSSHHLQILRIFSTFYYFRICSISLSVFLFLYESLGLSYVYLATLPRLPLHLPPLLSSTLFSPISPALTPTLSMFLAWSISIVILSFSPPSKAFSKVLDKASLDWIYFFFWSWNDPGLCNIEFDSFINMFPLSSGLSE